MLLGARQVGKTYIIDKFCLENFDNYVKVNLFERQDIVQLYKKKISSDDKYVMLKALVNFDLDMDNTVLFIDEIQESEQLISELKYFCERHAGLKVICAGSLLGVKLKRSHFSFPVGKVKISYLYPMDFEEFMWAFDKQLLLNQIEKCFNNDKELAGPVHDMAMHYYRIYLITGGMPESVKNMVCNDGDIIKYDKSILDSIIESYFEDMNKYVDSNSEALKINSTYRSIPVQLANNSKKFQYSKVSSGARAREYETVLDWLFASNMIIKANLISKPSIPPELYKKNDVFKLYLNDVGILVNLLQIKNSDIITDNMSENKGIITENYVANQLYSNGYTLYYWISGYSAEVDFVIYNDDGLIPIEVKSSSNTQSKSLKSYMEKYNPKYAIRISSKNFGFKNNIKSVPLYATYLIKNK